MSEKIVVPNTSHSRTGASGAHRWMNCPGSVQLVEKLVDQHGSKIVKSGFAADEGTAAHLVCADCLVHDRDAWEYAGKVIEVDGNDFTVDDEMVAAVQVFVDHVRAKMEQLKERGAKLYVERMMSSMFHDDAYGTSDVVIVVPGDRIIIVDFKYGQGVVVEPHEEQLREYGYLAVENYDGDPLKVVELHIVQPRIPHLKGPIRLHVTDPAELEEFFAQELLPAMNRTRDPDAPLAIGDWCRFCPAKEHCPALHGETMGFDVSLDPVYMDGDELGRALEKIRAIKKFGEKLEAEAFKRAMRGEHVAGQKLVRKQSNRIFKDGAEEAARKKWGEQAYEAPKFKTPPNIEELEGGKSFVTKWAYKPDAGLTMAPESDKRDAVKPPMEEYMEQEEG